MSLQTVIAKIEADITAGWHKVEDLAVEDAGKLWSFATHFVSQELPKVEPAAIAYLERAVADVASGDLADIVQAALMLAETEGSTVLKDLEEQTLNVLAALAQHNGATAGG